MLKIPRLSPVYRQLAVYDSLLTGSSKRINIDRISIKSSLGRRPFSAIRSPVWNRLRIQSPQSSPLFRAVRNVRRNGTRVPSAEQAGSGKPLSLSDRMKQMSRKYGWTVVGIYLGLSVLDFPFCFLAVRLFGTERIGRVEHALIDWFWGMLESVAPSLKERKQRIEAEAEQLPGSENAKTADSAVKHEDASIWTQLIIAYGVHKSLIFFRIPLTLAITPKVVKTLRSWGWKIGKTTPKPT